MIKDWRQQCFFNDEGVFEYPVLAIAPQEGCNLNATESKDYGVFNISVIVSLGFSIEEAQDITNFTVDRVTQKTDWINGLDTGCENIFFWSLPPISETESPAAEANCALAVSEIQDSAVISVSTEAVYHAGGGVRGYYRVPLIPLLLVRSSCRLSSSEAQDKAYGNVTSIPISECSISSREASDIAGFSVMDDFTDDEIVMMLMMAAYENELTGV